MVRWKRFSMYLKKKLTFIVLFKYGYLCPEFKLMWLYSAQKNAFCCVSFCLPKNLNLHLREMKSAFTLQLFF